VLMGINGDFLTKALESVVDVGVIKLSFDVIYCPQSVKMRFVILHLHYCS
jgi:hypothetical protein